MHRLREFMFERVYLAEHAQAEHARAHATIATIVTHLSSAATRPDEIVEYVAGMTDRFALAYVEKL